MKITKTRQPEHVTAMFHLVKVPSGLSSEEKQRYITQCVGETSIGALLVESVGTEQYKIVGAALGSHLVNQTIQVPDSRWEE